jgi:hypothetical protein
MATHVLARATPTEGLGISSITDCTEVKPAIERAARTTDEE